MSDSASPPNFPASLLRLRLQELKPNEIPAHEVLASQQEDASKLPELNAFAKTVLDTGHKHITASDWVKKGAPKPSPPSAAKVQVLTKDYNNETWFMRSSLHEDAKGEGTATFDEYDAALYQDHSIKESEYTPDLFDARKVAGWTVGNVEGWTDVVIELYEMVHDLPGPLTHRVFSTLVTRGRRSATEFITVQAPVDLRECPGAFYSNGRHAQEGETDLQKGPVLIGEYTSVERCVKQDDGRILWDMGLTSDAKGNLPMFVQKMSLPGAVAKDVGFVQKWVDDRRAKV